MQTLLLDLLAERCLVYLDDIIVHGSTIEDALDDLRLVFTRLYEIGFKLKSAKCKFLQQEVTYLGHIVTAEGIRCDPSKIEQVRTWPTPKNTNELRSFLGLASYYRRFIKDFSHIASPLNTMLGKDVPFIWTPDAQIAFDNLRGALCSPPVLAYPDTSSTAGIFILDTDASDTAIGAVLSQRSSDDTEHVIAYSSRGLCRREKNYCTTRKEMLALISSLGKFRHYLLGRRFLVRTDHQSLLWLQNFRDPEGQTARWQEYLQEYDFECQHRPGKKHGNADALSRRPINDHGECTSCSEIQIAAITFKGDEHDQWAALHASDPETSRLYAHLKKNKGRPSVQEMQGSSWEGRCLWSMWDHLEIVNEVLYFQNGPVYLRKLVVPQSMVGEIIQRVHEDVGHSGLNKTDQVIRRRFWWPHLRRDVFSYC